MGVIARAQVCFGNRLPSTDTLGHILTGHFKMDATGVGALCLMHGEETTDFFENFVDRPGLIAI